MRRSGWTNPPEGELPDEQLTITPMKESQCCECGHKVDRTAGLGAPGPGDFTLCFKCHSLNVFGDDLALRAPTVDEALEAAGSPAIQNSRRQLREWQIIEKLMGIKPMK